MRKHLSNHLLCSVFQSSYTFAHYNLQILRVLFYGWYLSRLQEKNIQISMKIDSPLPRFEPRTSPVDGTVLTIELWQLEMEDLILEHKRNWQFSWSYFQHCSHTPKHFWHFSKFSNSYSSYFSWLKSNFVYMRGLFRWPKKDYRIWLCKMTE